MALSRASLMEYITEPCNRGQLSCATHVGIASIGGSPPYVTIFLAIEDDVIKAAKFEAQGCGYTIACCAALTEILTGMQVSAARALTSTAILAVLPELPSHRHFCATLAIEALEQALAPKER